MSREFGYWTSVLKRVLVAGLAIFITYVGFKLAIFYMPFLIAFIISLIIEPIIKLLMRKFNFTRRSSSIIVFVVTFGIIIGLLSCGVVTIVSESSNLLSDFNSYYDNIYYRVQNLLEKFNSVKLRFSKDLVEIIERNSFTILENVSKYFQNVLIGIVGGIKLIPCMMIYVGVTILALYFICTDKIYMLDELEHHLPEKWMMELTRPHKGAYKGFRWIFKGTIYFNFNFVCNFFSWFIYNVFFWIECWFSFNNCSCDSICRCASNTWFRNCYGSLGDFVWFKWRFKVRLGYNWIMDCYVGY